MSDMSQVIQDRISEAMNAAYAIARITGGNKIEGDGWKVYRIPGQGIRIDVSTYSHDSI